MYRPYGVYNGQSTYDLNEPWLRSTFQSPTRALAGQTHAAPHPIRVYDPMAGPASSPAMMRDMSPDFYPEQTSLPTRRRRRDLVPTDQFYPDEQMGLKGIDPFAQRDYNLGLAQRDAQLAVYGADKARADAEAESYRTMGPMLPYPNPESPEEFLVNSGVQPTKYGRIDPTTGDVIDDDGETPGAVYGMHPNPEFLDASANLYSGRALAKPTQMRSTDPAMLQSQNATKDLELAQQLYDNGAYETFDEAVAAVSMQRQRLTGAPGGAAQPTPAAGGARPNTMPKPAQQAQGKNVVHMTPEDAAAFAQAKKNNDTQAMQALIRKYRKGA